MPRARALSPAALQDATMALVNAMHDQGRFVDDARLVAQETVRAYLKGLDYRLVRDVLAVKGGRPISQTAKQLAAMRIGETLDFAPMSLQSLRGRMKTARRIASNEDMVWSASTQGGFIRVLRRPDGTPPVREATSPITKLLTSLEPGESRMAPELPISREGHAKLDGAYKGVARRVLDQADADWSVRTTTKGPRVTRIK